MARAACGIPEGRDLPARLEDILEGAPRFELRVPRLQIPPDGLKVAPVKGLGVVIMILLIMSLELGGQVATHRFGKAKNNAQSRVQKKEPKRITSLHSGTLQTLTLATFFLQH